MSNPTDPWAQNTNGADANGAPTPPADPYAAPAAPVYGAQPTYGTPATPPAYAADPYGAPAAPAASAYGAPAAPAYGAPAAPAYGAPAQGYPNAPYGYAAPTYPAAGTAYGAYPTQKTNTMAIVSIIASAAAVITGISAIVGIICGHIALGQIKRTGENGRGLAIAGLIIGYIFVGIGLLLILIGIIAAIAGAASYSSY